jgi:hypothetical protein
MPTSRQVDSWRQKPARVLSTVCSDFDYRAFTFFGRPFHAVRLSLLAAVKTRL